MIRKAIHLRAHFGTLTRDGRPGNEPRTTESTVKTGGGEGERWWRGVDRKARDQNEERGDTRHRTTFPAGARLEWPRHCLLISLKGEREFVMLPKPDQNGNRIIFHRLADSRPSQYMFNDGIKLLLMSVDASLYTNGCSEGYIFLFDMDGVGLGHLTRLSINSIRRFFEYLQEGMPVRLKAIHVLNAVWFIDKVLALIRPFMKREFYEMLHLYTGDISDVYPHIPPECLPKDFGGELDCVASLHEAHCIKLNQLQNYFREEEELFRNYSPENMRTNQKIVPDAIEDLRDIIGDDS